MSKRLLFIFFVFLSSNLLSQNTLDFEYDSSGNQIYRGSNEQILASRSIDTLDVLTAKKQMNSRLGEEEDEEFITISVAPNPVSDELQIPISV